MANVTISQLASANQLTGTEEIPVVQAGSTVKTTAADIANLAASGAGTLDVVTVGTLGSDSYFSFSERAYYSGTATGEQNCEIISTPDINLSAGGYTGGTPTATSVTFPTLTRAQNFVINNFTYLETVSAPELLAADGVNLAYNPLLTSISFPKLQSIGGYNGLQVGANNQLTYTTFSFPALTSSKLSCFNQYIGLTAITSTQFPALASFGIYIQSVSDLTEITLPTITEINGFGIQMNTYNSAFIKFHIPNLVSIKNYQINFSNTYGLSDVQFGTVGVTKTYDSGGSNANINFQGCTLSQASVDNILQVWASLDGTNGTTNVTYGNMYLNSGINAAPSQAGLNAVAILQSRGWYVATN